MDFDLLYALRNQQTILLEAQRRPEALAVGLDVWELRRKVLEPGNPELAIDDLQLGLTLMRNDYKVAGLAMMRRSLPGLEKAAVEQPATYTEARDIDLEQIRLLEASIETGGAGTTAPTAVLERLRLKF